MRNDIKKFLIATCAELGLSANYNLAKDIYVVHKRGYAIQNFNTKQYYEIPPLKRKQLLRGILKRGLTHNIGENNVKHSLRVKSQLGIRIV